MSCNIYQLPFRKRVALSAILLILAVILVLVPSIMYQNILSAINVQATEQIIKVGEWISLFLSAFFVWLWKKELGINSFGMFGSDKIESQTESDFIKRTEKDKRTLDESRPYDDIEDDMRKHEYEKRKKYILDSLNERHVLSHNTVAMELHISSSSAKKLLFRLIKDGLIRCDGFPKYSLYTSTSSFENRAIDWIRNSIERDYEIINERRFIMIEHKYAVDALLETKNRIFLLEVKKVNNLISIELWDNWLHSLYESAKAFEGKSINIVLGIVINDPKVAENINKLKGRITGGGEDVSMQIMTILENDLY